MKKKDIKTTLIIDGKMYFAMQMKCLKENMKVSAKMRQLIAQYLKKK